MYGGSERDAAGVGGAHSWRELHTNIARRHQQLSPPTISAASPPHPSKKSPKPPPLPANDYKIIVRIRGGLDCSKIHSCVLRQIILKAAGLPINEHTAQDQLRVNEISNTILVSTPNMDRADSYNTIRTLNFNGTTYEVATHVADPSDTCRGVILLPIDSPEQAILPTLISYNPDLTVGSARRLGNTESILITFQGKRVPYYINYEGCALRSVQAALQAPTDSLQGKEPTSTFIPGHRSCPSPRQEQQQDPRATLYLPGRSLARPTTTTATSLKASSTPTPGKLG
ncbi:hypothetical protein HPB49_010759 [Dermacentor silvarum]|uniref:Uncharacterized protein n=1 Tax=Dermacentor silvarum TaxID=543639 RepID=A0ACB8CWV8_DERSI|nr:hypothetical protein HPB49_010759 [Dermacentor silvarum]